jgi:hypothetical protein
MAAKVKRQYDFIGIEVFIGDLIAYGHGGTTGQALGKVVGFTAKGFKIEPIGVPGTRGLSPQQRWRYIDGKYVQTAKINYITRTSAQVVKISADAQELSELPASWLAEAFQRKAD